MTLDFAPAPPRPGLHALTLLVEHPVEGPSDGAGNPPMASQRAFLLLALGSESRRGRSHRRRAAPPRRARPPARAPREPGWRAAARPAAGPDGARPAIRAVARSRSRCPRRGTPRPSSRSFAPAPRAAAVRRCCSLPRLSTAPLARTSVAAATVDVLPDPARLPRLRRPAARGRARPAAARAGLRGPDAPAGPPLDACLTPAPTPTYGGDRDGKAQGLLPAARRSARREPDGHPPRVPEARASLRAGSGRGRVSRSCRRPTRR